MSEHWRNVKLMNINGEEKNNWSSTHHIPHPCLCTVMEKKWLYKTT